MMFPGTATQRVTPKSDSEELSIVRLDWGHYTAGKCPFE